MFFAIAVFVTATNAYSQKAPEKIAIIKADDVRGVTASWNRFFAISDKKGVKVSAGIICNSLLEDKKGYYQWLKSYQASGKVEFWNHGWDHKRWKDESLKERREFKGTGYDHQKKHFEDAQNIMKSILGDAPNAFGAPFNSIDANTVKVMNENTDMRLFFCYNAKGLQHKVLAPMALRGEHDGTGKPNFAKFKADYQKKKPLKFAAIQFHPNGFRDKQFVEYTKILDFLIAEGWTFALPSEYVTLQDNIKKKAK